MEITENRVTVRAKWEYIGVGIFLIVMALFFGVTAWRFVMYGEIDVIPDIFVGACLVCIMGFGIFSVMSNGKKLIIDGDGILCRGIFSKDMMKWAEVKDYGISYAGETRFRGRTYYLYFSRNELTIDNEYQKNIDRNTVKVFLFEGDEYNKAVTQIMPFCESHAKIQPFISK